MSPCHCRDRGQGCRDSQRLIDHSGDAAIEVLGDMADKDCRQTIVDEVVSHFGRIDILINNAGMIRRSPAVDFSEEDWATVIGGKSVECVSSFAGSGPADDRTRLGKIVNIASLLSFQGGITVPAYTASKSGVAGLTKALANEWAKFNVNVNAIAPGYMETNNTTALRADETRNRQILERIPAGRWGNPEDLAGAAVFLPPRRAITCRDM